jgi:hypothetical protein
MVPRFRQFVERLVNIIQGKSDAALRGGDRQPGVDECAESYGTMMLKMAW